MLRSCHTHFQYCLIVSESFVFFVWSTCERFMWSPFKTLTCVLLILASEKSAIFFGVELKLIHPTNNNLCIWWKYLAIIFKPIPDIPSIPNVYLLFVLLSVFSALTKEYWTKIQWASHSKWMKITAIHMIEFREWPLCLSTSQLFVCRLLFDTNQHYFKPTLVIFDMHSMRPLNCPSK